MHALPSRPTALVFDFDGTIGDTRTIILNSYKAAFDAVGIARPKDQEIAATIGIPLVSGFRRLTGEDDATVEAAVKAYRKEFRERGFQEIAAFPGIPEVVQACSAAGFRMAVASSRSNESLGDMISYLGLDSYFEVVASREDASREKPHPELLLTVLERLEVEPRRALMIGDTTFDIEMGHAAGSLSCAVSWGNHDRPTLESVNPTVIVDAADDFRHLLGLPLSRS